MRWLPHATWPAGKLNLSIMSAAYVIFGFSLLIQPHRWGSTPAYHVLLQLFGAREWGAIFLLSGTALGVAAWQFAQRRAVVAALTFAVMLTTGWMLAFVVRYLTSPSTTPETWVSWAVFDILLILAATGIDRPAALPPGAEVSDFRAAVDAALTAAEEGQRAALLTALDSGAGKRREAVSGALSAYGDALRAAVPAVPAPADLAQQAVDEAHRALAKAEEALARSTGLPVPHQDPP
jgi:hypothetical protein